MAYSRLTDRLVFDIKFLLWRAEVHLLSAEEVNHRYREIGSHYLQLADDDEKGMVRKELTDWTPTVQEHLKRTSACQQSH